jgi:hypothetical protein
LIYHKNVTILYLLCTRIISVTNIDTKKCRRDQRMNKSYNRRSFNRVKTRNFRIEYRIRDRNLSSWVEAVNVCNGGVCFLRDSVIQVGMQLEIRFPFKTREIVMRGTVIRFDGREVALEFKNSEEEINRFVETFNLEYQKYFKDIYDGKPDKLQRPQKCQHDNAASLDSILDIGID